MLGSSTIYLAILPFLVPTVLGQFNLKDNFVGNDFFSGFKWETFDDPTHGRVNYVDQNTARANNLSYATATTFWPYGGEIDILEGVNDGPSNLASLHTSKGCTMPQSRKQMGIPTSLDCDATSGSNQGCGNSFTKPNSYGSSLNSVGVYPLRSSLVVNPDDSWEEPQALFPTDACHWGQYFDAHNIVFDLTFCGDWAGSSFSCGGRYEDYVDQNPDKFKDAYWEVNAVRVYTP
ncbi:hypothetical protein ACEPAG_7992 [Sanghuangporus baumii]